MSNVLVTQANINAVKASVNQIAPGNKLVIVVGSTVTFDLGRPGFPPRVLGVSTPANLPNNTSSAPAGSTKSRIKTSDVLKAAVEQ